MLTGHFTRAGLAGDSRTLGQYLRPGWSTGLTAGAAWQLAEAYLYTGGRSPWTEGDGGLALVSDRQLSASQDGGGGGAGAGVYSEFWGLVGRGIGGADDFGGVGGVGMELGGGGARGVDGEGLELVFGLADAGDDAGLTLTAGGFTGGELRASAAAAAAAAGGVGPESTGDSTLASNWIVDASSELLSQSAASTSTSIIESVTSTSTDVWLRHGGDVLLGQAVHVDVATAVPSVLALVAAMQLYRLFSYFVP